MLMIKKMMMMASKMPDISAAITGCVRIMRWIPPCVPYG
jgi:hypothetical protein